jgi:beta-phosphoglucomutase
MIGVVIFDLDGLLVDSEPVQFRAFNDVFSRHGSPMSHDEYQSWRGWQVTGQWIESRGLDLDPDIRRAEKKLGYGRLIQREVELKPAAEEFVNLVAQHFRLCVASGSRRDSIEACLEKFELRALFEMVFSATELKRGKPDSDVFSRRHGKWMLSRRTPWSWRIPFPACAPPRRRE